MRLSTAMVFVAAGVVAWTVPVAGVRATYGARTTADEPQYLMTATSLAEDGNLDVSDERAAGRYRGFHEVGLPIQEEIRADGTRVSPHDPLLPALLALPMRVGGWLVAKLTLAVLAGLLAALMLWTAVRRFAVPLGVGTLAVCAFSLAAPIAVYGGQVYPELPAALAVTAAIAAVTGSLRARGLAVLGAACVALPWLSVKYLPVAAVLAGLAWWRLLRAVRVRVATVLAGVLVGAGAAYLVTHQAWYGGWTAYAAGSHFAGGEATVMGVDPDYLGRSVRLVGLLVDRGFGLAVWQPAYLLAIPALAALVAARPRGWSAVALPLVAGWLNATFVALTMHGWWWPGRQVVVVLPTLVLAVAWWSARYEIARRLLAAGLVVGASIYAWLVVEGLMGRLTLVVDFERTTMPLVRAMRVVLPDLRLHPFGTDALLVGWVVMAAALAAWGWHSVRDVPAPVEVGCAGSVAVGTSSL
ncbi:MAG: hypothetical protein FJW88_04910 [Actinobacteria bacterium]|nr:hypothetical protein [Actinomycetota bacterium]